MNTLVLALLVFAVLGITSAYWLGDASQGYNGVRGYSDEDEDSDSVDVYKRSGYNMVNRNLCTPWRAPCTLDTKLVGKYDFLRCCSGMACRCTMWGNNCRCESRLGR